MPVLMPSSNGKTRQTIGTQFTCSNATHLKEGDNVFLLPKLSSATMTSSHQYLWVDSFPPSNCSEVLGSGVEALPLPSMGWKEKAPS